jgi:hypothetical protein
MKGVSHIAGVLAEGAAYVGFMRVWLRVRRESGRVKAADGRRSTHCEEVH